MTLESQLEQFQALSFFLKLHLNFVNNNHLSKHVNNSWTGGAPALAPIERKRLLDTEKGRSVWEHESLRERGGHGEYSDWSKRKVDPRLILG